MILATVDIDDAATPKLRTFRNALDETASAVVDFSKSTQGMSGGIGASGDALGEFAKRANAIRGGLDGAGAGLDEFVRKADGLRRAMEGAGRDLDAFNKRASASKDAGSFAEHAPEMRKMSEDLAALTQRYQQHARAASDLAKSMQPGTAITKSNAEAFRELQRNISIYGQETPKTGAAINALYGSMKAGSTVSAHMHEQMRELATSTQASAQSFQQFGTTIPPVTQATQASTLSLAALTAALAAVTAGLGAYLMNAAETAARTEVLGTVLGVVATNSGNLQAEMIGQVEVTKALGVTTQAATEAVIDMAQANLNVADTSKLARVAQDLAVVAGKNTSDAFATLTRVIQTQQVQMLRQFGITKTMGAVMREFANEAGKTTKELTALDRQQAVLNLILKEGAQVAGAYEKAMGNAGKQATSLARYQEELSNKIGEKLMPAYRLWIALQTEAYKAMLDMGSGTTTLITALGLVVTAVTAMGAAFTGAKLLGIVTILQSIGAALTSMWAAFSASATVLGGVSAGFGALVVAMGPVSIVIGAIVLALGLLAGAYIYWAAQQQEVLDKNNEVVEGIAKTSAEVDNHIATIESLRNAHNRSAEETARLKQAVEDLNRIVGGSAFIFDESTGAVTETNGVLRTYTQRTEEATTALIAQNKAKIEQLEVDAALLKAQAWNQRQRSGASRAMGGAAFGIAGMVAEYYGASSALMEQQAAEMERIAKGLRESDEMMAKAFTSTGKSKDAVKYRNEAIREMENAFAEEKASFEQILKSVEAKDRAGRKIVEKYRQLEADMAKGIKTKDFRVMPTGADYEKVLSQIHQTYEGIVSANEDAAKKAGERAKKAYKNAFDGIFEGFNLNSPEIQGKLAGIAKLWEGLERTGDTAGMERALDLFGDSLLKLGSSADFAAKGMSTLSAMASDEQARRWVAWGQSVRDAYTKIVEAFEQSTMGGTDRQLQRAIEQEQQMRAASQKQIETKRATASEIRKIDQQIYEAEVIAHQSEIEQQVYAANKTIEEAERASNEKLRLMRLEMEETRKQNKEKLLLDRAAVQAQIDNILTVERIKKAAELRTMEGMASATEEQIRMQRESSEFFLNTLQEELNAVRDRRFMELDAAQVTADGILRIQEETYAATEQAQNASLDRQRAASARHVQRMIKDYQMLAQASKQIWTALVTGLVDAYKGMIAGTLTWREALLSVWNSILSAVSRIIDQIVDRWISGALRMATAEGGFSAKGFVQGLFGRGAQQAAGSAVAGVAGQGAAAAGFDYATAGATGVGYGAAQGGGAAAAAPGVTMAGTLVTAGGGAAAGGIAAHYLADGSYVKGTGYGAAAGAGAGAAIGTWVMPGIGTGLGAGIGALAGAATGWYVTRQQRKKMKEERSAFLEAAGGEESLRAKTEEAGVAASTFDTLMDTNSPKEYAKAIEEVSLALRKLETQQLVTASGGEEAFRQMAFEAGNFSQETINAFLAGTLSAEEMRDTLAQMQKDLELANAKDALAKTVTQMDDLRKAAVLAGYDLKRLYETESIEAFNAEQANLNRLLEEQQLRLAGLNTAAQGLALRVSGLTQTYGKSLESFVKGLSTSQQDAWKKVVEGTKEGEKSLVQRLREAQQAAGAGAGVRVGDLELTGAQGAELQKIFADVQKAITNIGGAAAATFGGILRETGNIGQAFDAISEPLDTLNALIQETGVEAPAALHHLLSLRQAVIANKDVVDSLGGITMMLKGLSDAGQLTGEIFNSMGADIAAQWDTMMGRGVAEDQALLMMQPTLQALYEAQKNFGFATDESTQKLIDMGLAQGIIGDNFQDVNSKMLDMLVIIAEAVGGTVPEAYRRQTDAEREAALAAAEAAEAQRVAAEAQAQEQDRLRQELERTGGAYNDLAQIDMSALPGEMERVADAVAPLPAAAEATAGEMTELAGVPMHELVRKLDETEQAVGMESGVGKAAEVAKGKLDEVNGVSMGAIQGALGNTEDSAYNIVGGADAATAAILAMVANTAGPLDEMAARVDAVSLGHSPGGLKEIRIQSEDGAAAIHDLVQSASIDLGKLEDEAANWLMTVDNFVDKITAEAEEGTATAAPKWAGPAPGRYDTTWSDQGAPSPAMLITINAPPIKVQINTMDPSKARDVWEQQIRPELERDLDTNHRQLGNRVGIAVRGSRHSRGLR